MGVLCRSWNPKGAIGTRRSVQGVRILREPGSAPEVSGNATAALITHAVSDSSLPCTHLQPDGRHVHSALIVWRMAGHIVAGRVLEKRIPYLERNSSGVRMPGRT